MRAPFILTSLLATLGTGLAAAAADPVDMEALRHMTAAQARTWAKRQIARQEATRAQRSTAKVDIVPPVLTAIEAPTSVDALAPASSFIVIKATDDLSGVRWGYAYATGPNGQSVVAFLGMTLPSKKYDGGMSLSQLTPFSQPGVYTVNDVYLFDVADNMAHFDEAALAALGGRTSFTVTNTRGYDTKGPVLRTGKVLTPQLSLSSTAPGTTKAPYAAIQVSAADVGDTLVSGVTAIMAEFCIPDFSACFSVNADDMRDGTSSTMRLAGQISADFGQLPGEYHLRNLQINDYAGNDLFMVSTEFGGGTDFSAYFPSTTITLTP